MAHNEPLDWDHNPHLRPWQRPQPNQVAGKGAIEIPSEVRNIIWQTRAAPPTPYENRLGDALVECFGEGVTELPDLVARLNAKGVLSPDGAPWTEESFTREMERLGA